MLVFFFCPLAFGQKPQRRWPRLAKLTMTIWGHVWARRHHTHQPMLEGGKDPGNSGSFLHIPRAFRTKSRPRKVFVFHQFLTSKKCTDNGKIYSCLKLCLFGSVLWHGNVLGNRHVSDACFACAKGEGKFAFRFLTPKMFAFSEYFATQEIKREMKTGKCAGNPRDKYDFPVQESQT